MRFVPPLAALATGATRFDGDQRARSRPMAGMLGALKGLGVRLETPAGPRLPFTVLGSGAAAGGSVTLDASESSQFVSGLLLAGARYQRGVDVRHVGPPLPSLPHIEMTVDQLRLRSVQVDDSVPDRWRVAPGSIAAHDTTIEPDLSTAAPFVAAALALGGSVHVPGWPRDTTQAGDRLRQLLTRLGGQAELSANGLTVTGSGEITGADLDLHDAGELTPVLTALCALASSPSQLSGIAHLRGHESDRLSALATQINGLGGEVTQTADGLRVVPRPLHAGLFRTYADHRLAQAAAVLGLRVPGILVDDIACVAKTHPGFVEAWAALLR
jgi:3-phosphoshikimate 1-carboxyvinyltransferase